MSKLTRQEWNRLWALQEQCEASKREKIRQAVASSEAPLSPDLVDAVVNLNDAHTRVNMRDHKGFQLAERRDSYLTSLAILESCLQDLLSAICVFENKAFAEGSDLFDRSGEGEINRIRRQIQKELFATANAAASLVDHARRVDKCHTLNEYDAKRIEYFGTDGIHDFVIALRNMMQHLHIVDANSLITHELRTGTKTATFTISKKAVLRSDPKRFSGNAGASMLAFVQASPESIDLRELFYDYRTRTSKFHGWMKNELASETLTALRDYDRIIQEKKNFDNRLIWKTMMGNWFNWKVPPDPHNHLPRFLNATQLEEVYRLPRNSEAQVDLVIAYMDENNAIDDDLRTMAYTLFTRSPQLEADSRTQANGTKC
jgi:hypothetical protein